MTDHKLVISQGKRPFWRTLVTTIFFTMMVFEIWSSFSQLYFANFSEKSFRYFAHSLGPIAYWFGFGVSTGLMKTIAIDTSKEILITTYFIGPFSKDFTATIPELQYISVFKDAKEHFQVNLWCTGNKRYNMFTFDKWEPAFIFAKAVCLKLNLELLDATERGNNKWIEAIKA